MRPTRLLSLAIIATSLSTIASGAESQPQTLSPRPIVVELFTSQGCSSCPNADALLRELDAQPIEGAQIIVLSQHVDYWNSLGWNDPFSAREFTDRQRRYGSLLSAGRVYTPQMVIDGTAEFVGNRRADAFDIISAAARAPHDPTTILIETSWVKSSVLSLDVTLPDLSKISTAFDVMLAITESELTSDVTSGENAGRRLSHAGVVRQMKSLRTVAASAEQFEVTRRIPIDSTWNRSGLRAIVLLQERDQGRILGAATARFPPERETPSSR